MARKEFNEAYAELVSAWLHHHDRQHWHAPLPELFEARINLDTARLRVARHRRG